MSHIFPPSHPAARIDGRDKAASATQTLYNIAPNFSAQINCHINEQTKNPVSPKPLFGCRRLRGEIVCLIASLFTLIFDIDYDGCGAS